jgi:hypothetical protein
MGVAVGDYDGDGREDLFVTGWRDQRLYRNRGGWFEDVTVRAGLASSQWSTSAAFADLDRDGDLDLYVANYLEYDARHAPYCAAPDGRRDYCSPEDFRAQPDRLYRNNGDGTFTDVGKAAGILDTNGRGLGVLIADLTGDSWLDIFVANDGTPCYLFENCGGLRFQSVGEQAGVALDGQGSAIAAMGVACGDLDGDGRTELAIGNLYGRSTVLFSRVTTGTYLDVSTRWALPAATRDFTGFGVALADFDGDAQLDLFQANGHVLDRARLSTPLAMTPLVLKNQGSRFEDASRAAGSWFSRPILGRGVAVGDLNEDGKPDVVINAIDAPAAILKNESVGPEQINVQLVGAPPSCREAIGARLTVKSGHRTLMREVVGGGSYLSASSRSVTVPRERGGIDRIEVSWPSGRVEVFNNIPAEHSVRLTEGAGVTSTPARSRGPDRGS